MGLFKIFGKSLEISGRILQAEGVQEWLEHKGKTLFEEWTVKKGIKYFAGYRGKKLAVQALQSPFKSRPFFESIDHTFEEFCEHGGKIAQMVGLRCSQISNFTYFIPYFLLDDIAFEKIESRIRNWDEFKRLYPDELIKQLFFQEWRSAIKANISSLQPTVKKPIKLEQGYFAVAIDDEAFWSVESMKGTYYVHHNLGNEITSGDFITVNRQIIDLDKKRGELSSSELNSNLSAFVTIADAIRNVGGDYLRAGRALINSHINISLSVR